MGKVVTILAIIALVLVPMTASAEYIVDNDESAYVESSSSWYTADSSGWAPELQDHYWGDNYSAYIGTGSLDDFVWNLDKVEEQDEFYIFTRWIYDPDSDSRTDNATYTISHDGGSISVSVNQNTNLDGEWFQLVALDGTPLALSFDGIDDKVELAAVSGKYVIADAIRLVEVSNVPLPGAVWLLGSGLIGLIGLRKSCRK